MKKVLYLLLSISLVLFFAGCGATDTAEESEAANTEEASTNDGTAEEESGEAENDEPAEVEDSEEEAEDGHVHSHGPLEPNEDTVCDSCNMKVYQKDHELGVFTAQGVTQDGENVFFDDIGCILNYERKNGEELAVEWIRDYLTLEWVELDEGTPVKTNITSPMKYGYIFFNDEEQAKAFIEDEANSTIEPTLAEWSEVDAVANERFQNKMKAQQEQKQMQHGQNN